MAFWLPKWRAVDADTARDLGFRFDDQKAVVRYYKGIGAQVVGTRASSRKVIVRIPIELFAMG